MIVHVNPYDTGFEENSHIMRFASIAREVQTTASNPITRAFQKMKIKVPVPAAARTVSNSSLTSPKLTSVMEREFELVEGACHCGNGQKVGQCGG